MIGITSLELKGDMPYIYSDITLKVHSSFHSGNEADMSVFGVDCDQFLSILFKSNRTPLPPPPQPTNQPPTTIAII